MLNIEKIKEHLNKLGAQAPEIFLFDITDSTNTRAKEYAKASAAQRAAVFLSEEQTAGRGRRGRSFFSERGAGIYISFLLYPKVGAEDAVKLTARAVVKLARAIRAVCHVSPRIKWVNDLYAGNKKLAGILCEGEATKEGKIAYTICGMGINVYKNAITEEISDIATSIESISGERVDRNLLAAEIIAEFIRDETEEEILEEYRRLSFIPGLDITVIPTVGESYPAKALEILDDYSLLIEAPDKKISRLFTGEVSVKIIQKSGFLK